MKKILFLTVFCLVAVSALFSQRTITGTVTSEGNTEIAVSANVIVKGTDPLIGTSTDRDGMYSIKVPAGFNVLVFTYLGYKTLELNLDEHTNVLNVDMIPDVSDDRF